MKGKTAIRTKRIRNTALTATAIGLLLTVGLTACKERELGYALQAEITVDADWSRADLEEEGNYGATVLFYPKGGGEPRTVLMGDRKSATVRLPQGSYDVILFNRSYEDFGAVAFRGKQSFATLEAYARKVETRANTRVIVSSPEKMATAVVRDFKVTVDMLGNYAPQKSGDAGCTQGKCGLKLEPAPLTRRMEVRLKVKGLHNVQKARCVLQAMPLSVLMCSGQPGQEKGGQEFALGNPQFENGSLTEGTLTGRINTFGDGEGVLHGLEVEALLVDGKTTVRQTVKDVAIGEEEDGEGNRLVTLEAEMPEAFPDVKPEGGSGFEADVDEWGEEKTQEVPV